MTDAAIETAADVETSDIEAVADVETSDNEVADAVVEAVDVETSDIEADADVETSDNEVADAVVEPLLALDDAALIDAGETALQTECAASSMASWFEIVDAAFPPDFVYVPSCLTTEPIGHHSSESEHSIHEEEKEEERERVPPFDDAIARRASKVGD